MATPPSLIADPRDRLGVSAPPAPPRRRGLSAPMLVISLVGLTGGLALIFSAVKVTGILG